MLGDYLIDKDVKVEEKENTISFTLNNIRIIVDKENKEIAAYEIKGKNSKGYLWFNIVN